MSNDRTLTLGHSPDSDDAFMFYGLASGKVSNRGWRFKHVIKDIQSLNELALAGTLDITAISVHAYALVADSYSIMTMGASMGDGYGPIIIARSPLTRERLMDSRIAIPGLLTSACLAMQLWLDKPARDIDMLVVPFDKVFQVVSDGEADAGLIIHEGQITYNEHGFHLCIDLGKWWKDLTGLPLPLGINVIKNLFNHTEQSEITEILRDSVIYGLNHLPEAIEYAKQYSRGLNTNKVEQFVSLYVNKWTVDLGEEGKRAIELFLNRAQEKGFIQMSGPIKFV